MSATNPRGPDPGLLVAPPQVYRIDSDDRLTYVNDAYLEEASGGAPLEATRAELIGRDFWSLMPSAAPWYQPLVRGARDEGRVFAFAFRCDTPTLRRLMRMQIEATADRAVSFMSSVIRQQPRARVALLDPAEAVGQDLVSMCSWCKRVRAGEEWLEVEPALERLGIDPQEQMPCVSHGICQRCKTELVAMATSRSATTTISLPDDTERR